MDSHSDATEGRSEYVPKSAMDPNCTFYGPGTSSCSFDDAIGSFDIYNPFAGGYFSLLPRDVFLYLLSFLLVPTKLFAGAGQVFDFVARERDLLKYIKSSAKKVKAVTYRRGKLNSIKIYPGSWRSVWLIRFMQTCKLAQRYVNCFRDNLVQQGVFDAKTLQIEEIFSRDFRIKQQKRIHYRMRLCLGQALCPSAEELKVMSKIWSGGGKAVFTVPLSKIIVTDAAAGNISILKVWNAKSDHSLFNKMIGNLKEHVDYSVQKSRLPAVTLKIYAKFVTAGCEHGPECKRFVCKHCQFVIHKTKPPRAHAYKFEDWDLDDPHEPPDDGLGDF